MGMYTEFALGFRFQENLPEEVLEALNVMVGCEDECESTIDHPFFKTDRWSWMLRSGGSYYFDPKPVLKFIYDDISKVYHLTVWANIKNYGREIELFLDWVSPYIDTDGSKFHYLGFTRYERCPRPTLIYLRNGEIVRENVNDLVFDEELW